MKININVTVELDPGTVKALTRRAKDAGHGYDGTTAPSRLVRRLLEAAVKETVARAHEDRD